MYGTESSCFLDCVQCAGLLRNERRRKEAQEREGERKLKRENLWDGIFLVLAPSELVGVPVRVCYRRFQVSFEKSNGKILNPLDFFSKTNTRSYLHPSHTLRIEFSPEKIDTEK